MNITASVTRGYYRIKYPNRFLIELILKSMCLERQLPDESELVNALKNKSEIGFQLLYKQYSASLFGIINKIIPNKDIAEDILHDSLIKIWKSMDSYDPNKGRLFTWMANITRNRSIDTLRSKRYKNIARTYEIDINIKAIDVRQSNTFNIDTIGLRELTAKLEQKHFEVLDLVYFAGYTHVEAADILTLPLGTVKTRIKNAIKELRKYFNFNSEVEFLLNSENETSSVHRMDNKQREPEH